MSNFDRCQAEYDFATPDEGANFGAHEQMEWHLQMVADAIDTLRKVQDRYFHDVAPDARIDVKLSVKQLIESLEEILEN